MACATGVTPLLGDDLVVLGDNLTVMATLPDGAFQFAYLDPPFNTGHERVGAAGSFADRRGDWPGFLRSRLVEVHRLLSADGTVCLHLDRRELRSGWALLDEVFGEDAFVNEIVWAYDYGGRARDRWPQKHDTILLYARDPKRRFFDTAAVERIPYLAPGLVGPEKAARGKLPTDVWWHTIVPTRGWERTGWPTQKPEGVIARLMRASSAPGAWVLDPFAGSGTTGAVARRLGRRFVLVDEQPAALAVMGRRLGHDRVTYLGP